MQYVAIEELKLRWLNESCINWTIYCFINILNIIFEPLAIFCQFFLKPYSVSYSVFSLIFSEKLIHHSHLNHNMWKSKIKKKTAALHINVYIKQNTEMLSFLGFSCECSRKFNRGKYKLWRNEVEWLVWLTCKQKVTDFSPDRTFQFPNLSLFS